MKQIETILNEWGFTKHQRNCQQPSKDHYGEEITVLEEWDNKELAKLLEEELKRE